jgi:hypothetical protein
LSELLSSSGKSWQLSLDPEFSYKEELLELLKSYSAKEMVATPVSKLAVR